MSEHYNLTNLGGSNFSFYKIPEPILNNDEILYGQLLEWCGVFSFRLTLVLGIMAATFMALLLLYRTKPEARIFITNNIQTILVLAMGITLLLFGIQILTLIGK